MEPQNGNDGQQSMPVGIQSKSDSPISMTAFPNPSEYTITLSLQPSSEANYRVVVIGMDGVVRGEQIVRTSSSVPSSCTFEFSSFESSGWYAARVYSPSGVLVGSISFLITK